MKQFGASTKSFPLLHTNKRQFFQLLFSHIRSFIAQDWIFAPEADEADVYTLKSCKSPRFVEAVTVLLGFCYLPADRGMHLELKMSSWLPPRRVGDSLGIPSFAISQWQKLQRRLVAYLSSGNEGCEREKKSKKKSHSYTSWLGVGTWNGGTRLVCCGGDEDPRNYQEKPYDSSNSWAMRPCNVKMRNIISSWRTLD